MNRTRVNGFAIRCITTLPTRPDIFILITFGKTNTRTHKYLIYEIQTFYQKLENIHVANIDTVYYMCNISYIKWIRGYNVRLHESKT